MDHNEEELIQEYISGNPEATAMIFERYKSRVFNFCLRILGNRADAEDATGEAFLAVFEKKYSYDPKARFSTWLFTVARNCCIDRIRKKRFTVSLWFTGHNGGTQKFEAVDGKELPGQELAEAESAQRVRQAIARLPVEQKEAIILREYHDFSYEEIAQILKCSLEKVKILIYRARENLKGDLISLQEEGAYE